jgi:energy-coupling factor transporter ATP-binding protein EcfA2
VNAVVSTLLGLDDILVLHASAINLGTQSLLIAGPSGSGKTTLATVLCAAGAMLVSDDAVRLDGNVEVFAYPGTTELRVRSPGESLVQHLDWPRRQLLDGRVAVIPKTCRALTRVAAVWLPRIGPVMAPSARRIHGAAALLSLTSALRVAWVPARAARFLSSLSRLARHIPIYEVTVPNCLLGDDAAQAAVVKLAALHIADSTKPLAPAISGS